VKPDNGVTALLQAGCQGIKLITIIFLQRQEHIDSARVTGLSGRRRLVRDRQNPPASLTG
jgi:hypothetical protein